jgi:response regulator RpfG family c-di-GMP phosphodiesterase
MPGGNVETENAPSSARTAAARKKLSLLLVDDEPNVLSALRRHFRQRYAIHEAESGTVALAILEREEIDAIITDMRMPTMNGAELLRAVSIRWPTTVRILLTGYADLKVTTDAIREGLIDHFLTKPWEPEEITDCVDRALSTRVRAERRGGK